MNLVFYCTPCQKLCPLIVIVKTSLFLFLKIVLTCSDFDYDGSVALMFNDVNISFNDLLFSMNFV